VLRLLLLGQSSSRLSLLGVLLVVLLGLASLGLLGFLLLTVALLLVGIGRDEILLLRQVGIGDARHLHGVARMPCGLRGHIPGIHEELVEAGQVRLPTRLDRRRSRLGAERLGFLGLEGKVADIGKIEHVRALMRSIIGVAVASFKLIRRVLFDFLRVFGYVLLRLRVILHCDIGAVDIVGIPGCCLFVAACHVARVFSVLV